MLILTPDERVDGSNIVGRETTADEKIGCDRITRTGYLRCLRIVGANRALRWNPAGV